eukprot:Em0074g17a
MPVTTLTHSRTIVSTPLSSSGSLIGAQTSSAGSQTPQVGSTHAIAEMVTLNEFADAFLKGDVTNWYPRMALLDHIEAVQKKMAAWMDEVEQQLEGVAVELVEDTSSPALLKLVNETLQDLSTNQQSLEEWVD